MTATSADWLSALERGYVSPPDVDNLIGLSIRELRRRYGLCWPKLQGDHYPAREALDVALALAHQRQRERFLSAPGSLLERRYARRFDCAVADAAEAMFALNRYAKGLEKHDPQRDEIYTLKNEFIARLFERGLCLGWNLHEVIKPEKVLYCYCGGSGGSGNYDDSDSDEYDDSDGDEYDDDEGCERCSYTGVYRVLPALTLSYVVLRFGVGGRRYTWHQPTEIVTFDYTSAPRYDDDKDWEPSVDRAVELGRLDIAERVALIRWAIQVF